MPCKQTVENIMVPLHHFPLVRKDDVVAEAIRVMRHFFHRQDGTWYGFQAALVMNQKDQPVGLLTLRGLLRAFQLQAIQDHLLKGDATGLFFMGKFNDSLEIVVRDIMRPINLITVQKGSSVFEVIRKMHKWKISLLPVMDGGELVGMVRTIDVFWIVGELLD